MSTLLDIDIFNVEKRTKLGKLYKELLELIDEIKQDNHYIKSLKEVETGVRCYRCKEKLESWRLHNYYNGTKICRECK